jgi:3-deoxy-manno-octulosonate cytidylyltransferase (CMP-KDO synthetase)
MFHVVIPARYASIRLPGKPLLLIGGKPLIQWVWERAMASGAASVMVATDDERILAAATAFGAECIMTSTRHASGTDRIAEVAQLKQLADDDIVVNLQGDEPLMPASVISEVAAALRAGIDIATAVAPITALTEFLDPNCVKALRARDGLALYFSRAPVPWPRDATQSGATATPAAFAGAWRHVGIYAYRVGRLLEFARWPPSFLEITEKLEQLRALEGGMKIQLVTLAAAPPAGVDTLADLQRVRETIGRRPGSSGA